MLKLRPEIFPVVVSQVKPVPPKIDWPARPPVPDSVVENRVYMVGSIVVVVLSRFNVSVVPAPKKTLPVLPTLSVLLWPGDAAVQVEGQAGSSEGRRAGRGQGQAAGRVGRAVEADLDRATDRVIGRGADCARTRQGAGAVQDKRTRARRRAGGVRDNQGSHWRSSCRRYRCSRRSRHACRR